MHVYGTCTFKHVVSHEPVTKPNQTNHLCFYHSPFSNPDHWHRVDGPVHGGDDGAGRERQDLERDLEGGLRTEHPVLSPTDRPGAGGEKYEIIYTEKSL